MLYLDFKVISWLSTGRDCIRLTFSDHWRNVIWEIRIITELVAHNPFPQLDTNLLLVACMRKGCKIVQLFPMSNRSTSRPRDKPSRYRFSSKSRQLEGHRLLSSPNSHSMFVWFLDADRRWNGTSYYCQNLASILTAYNKYSHTRTLTYPQ